MSSDLSIELREFHQFLGQKLAAGTMAISPEQALDEWRLAHRSEEELADDIAAVREALDDMSNGDAGMTLAEFDQEFRRRHGLPKRAMTFLIRVLGRAQADVDNIYLWLCQRSPMGAIAWYAVLLEKLAELGDNASSCSIAPESARIGVELRQAFFKTRRGRTYRLLFVIVGAEARVLRVRGPGQRPVTRLDVTLD